MKENEHDKLGPFSEELVLVQACLSGSDQAWEFLITRYRPVLFPTALAITRDASLARELSDSLWADLFGTKTDQQGRRVSKLSFCSGRGSLEGWLRALLAQEYVTRFRRNHRFVRLDNATVEAIHRLPEDEVVTPADTRLDRALEQALARLKEEDRLLLVSYYLDERSLAEIGKMLNVHESTVSRRLKKTLRLLRKRVLLLVQESGMSRREAEQLIQTDVHQVSVAIRDQLWPAKAPL
jgi:RNA polymerase sigma-70 factor (ECF subfamily)